MSAICSRSRVVPRLESGTSIQLTKKEANATTRWVVQPTNMSGHTSENQKTIAVCACWFVVTWIHWIVHYW